MSSQHTITALVQNEAGTLNRLVSLFRRRGFSLASVNAADCEQEGFSRLTLVVNGDDTVLSQCVRQLQKLVEVVEVDDLPARKAVQRELGIVQVKAMPGKRSEVLEVVQVFGGKVSHLSAEAMAVEFTGEPSQVDRLIGLLKPYGIKEVVRTGVVAMRVEA